MSPSKRFRLMMSRLTLRIVTIVLVVAVLISGLFRTQLTRAAEGGTITWARYGDADTLDPQAATSTLSWQVYDQVYDTLLAFDMTGKVVPNLAKEYSSSADGTIFTFKLNEGIMCHDGTPFNAAAVKFTAERALDPKTGNPTKTSWGPLKSVETVDDLTVQFTFSTPFGPFVTFMADPFASMICPSGVAKHGDQFGNNPVGTGPWKFVSWTKGDQIVLERNPNYKNFGRPVTNKGAPYAEKLVIKTIPEPQTRLAALQSDQVSLAEPPLEEVANIKKNSKYKLYVAEKTGQLQFFEFAVSRPPFNDIRARQAIAYAVDPAAMANIVFEGLVEPQYCAIGPGILGYNKDWCQTNGFKPDPEKAKALLKELGYGPDKPLEIIMMSYTGGNRDKTLQVFQQQLEAVGIKTEIQMMDIGTLNARVKQENNTKDGKGAMDSMGWAWFDPDILYQLWHSPGAYDGFNTPELDKLLEETRTTTDPVQRAEKVKAATKYLYDQAVMVPLYSPAWEWIYASKADLEGFVYGPFNRPLFNDVKVPAQ